MLLGTWCMTRYIIKESLYLPHEVILAGIPGILSRGILFQKKIRRSLWWTIEKKNTARVLKNPGEIPESTPEGISEIILTEILVTTPEAILEKILELSLEESQRKPSGMPEVIPGEN